MTSSATRVPGVDLARGLAVLAMIQTHAYDGWVRDDARDSFAYGVTRVIATLALPSFLLLAGVSAGLRLQSTPRPALRSALVRRGWMLVLLGYGYSAACALLDDAHDLDTVLRADVLHAIGLSLASLAWLVLPSPTRRGTLLMLAVLLACPLLSRLAAHVAGPGRYPLALLVDVPRISRMPLIPLLAWASAGLALAGALGRISPRTLALAALTAAISGNLGQRAYVALSGQLAARTNLGIVFNAVDLLGRALCVLALGLWLAPRLAGAAHSALQRLGRHSLLVYMLHLPFCYGRLARPLSHALMLPAASLVLVALVLACSAVAWLTPRVSAAWRRSPSASRAPADPARDP